jgi:hypothetical protein
MLLVGLLYSLEYCFSLLYKPLTNQHSTYRHYIVTSLSIIDTHYNVTTNVHRSLKHIDNSLQNLTIKANF